MATELKKAVYRRALSARSNRGRRLIVGLEPGDIVTVREERTRAGNAFSLTIEDLYYFAVSAHVDHKRREKAKAKKLKKKGLK